MQYANAVEAAKLLDVNERTIRRWIYRGLLGRVIDEHGEVIAESRIPAIEPVQKLNERRFSIPLSNIQILSDRMGKTTLTELDLRLTELEALVKRQGEQISTFLKLLNEPDRDRTAHKDISGTIREQRPDTRPVIERPKVTETPDSEAAADEMSLPDFAKLHKTNPHTLRDQINHGIHGDFLIATKRPKPGRAGEHTYSFTREQHLQAVEFWRRNGRLDKYQPCDLCRDSWSL